MNQELKKELEFCLKLWSEKGFCEFGSCTKCSECASPYVLWKLLTGEVLHGKEIKRLSLEDWKKKFEKLNKICN